MDHTATWYGDTNFLIRKFRMHEWRGYRDALYVFTGLPGHPGYPSIGNGNSRAARPAYNGSYAW